MRKSESEGVAALGRGLEILRCFSAREPLLSNSELASYTGLPRSTVSRLTKTLVDLGYLRHHPTRKRYSVGASVLALGYAALANQRVADVARPHMQALADATGALISLATRDRLSMIYFEACASDSAMTLKMGRGLRMPMMTTSIGRAFLAALPAKERDYLVACLKDKNEPPVTTAQITELKREFKRYREHGHCLSLGHWRPDVNAAATAIANSGDTDQIVLSISGPAFLITPTLLDKQLVPRMKGLALHISEEIKRNCSAIALK